MRVNRYHILILLLALCSSCIEPFNPLVEDSQEALVINGFITDRPGPHQVVISRSTPYSDPSHVTVSGCVVTVEDETGQMVEYSETSPGVYVAYLEPGFLQVGKSYTLFVNTLEGNEYRSDFESLLACSPVDSIYYEVMEVPTTDPDEVINGVQFYVDVKGTSETAPNYRWVMIETWRYTAPYFADFSWDGIRTMPYTSQLNCYMTDTVRGLFTASTRYLSENHLNRKSLHYVSNETPRLGIEYSVLVEQHSLTDPAFEYWDRIESQTSEGSGLYETQLSSIIGNIYNVNDPSEKVLGYFYATQVQQERLTFTNHFDFGVKGYNCALDTVHNLYELGSYYPYYLFSIDVGLPYFTGGSDCFDCTSYGGTTEPPEFF